MLMRRVRSIAALCGLALFAIATGCRPAPMGFPAALNSQRADERLRAARQAADYSYASPEERRAVLELLVARLDDEDDAVRFFSILALERLEGTRLGYRYQDPLERRLRAVQAWRRHLAQQAGEPHAGETIAGGEP